MTTKAQEYVVGFLFDKEHVLLVRKLKPEWQAGYLNGVGGKIEEGEVPPDAMSREFKEETGVSVPDWSLFCQLIAKDSSWRVFFFKANHRGEDYVLPEANDVGEELARVKIAKLRYHTIIPNLSWLIPLALDPSNLVAQVTDCEVAGLKPGDGSGNRD